MFSFLLFSSCLPYAYLHTYMTIFLSFSNRRFVLVSVYKERLHMDESSIQFKRFNNEFHLTIIYNQTESTQGKSKTNWSFLFDQSIRFVEPLPPLQISTITLDVIFIDCSIDFSYHRCDRMHILPGICRWW